MIVLDEFLPHYKDEKGWKKSLINYHDKYYIPNNSILVVSGDFDRTTIFNKIVKEFEHVKNIPLTINATFNIQQEIPQLSIIYGKQLFQTNVIIGFRTFKHTDERNYEMDLISKYLSSGFTSILFSLLRTKLGVAYMCSTANDTYNDHGMFYIITGLESKKAIDAVILILNELKKIKKGKIDNNIFKSSKKIYETSMLFDLISPFDYTMSHGMKELTDLGNISNEYELNKIKKLTIKDITKVAKEVFVSSGLNISILCEKIDKNRLIHNIYDFDN